MECRVDLLSKNRRYRILNIDDKHYILDIETSIWPIFFPFLFWLMPQKIYKIDFETVKKLKVSVSGTSNLGIIMIVGIGGSAVLSRILQPMLDFSIQTTTLGNVVMLIIPVVIITFLRLYLRGKLNEKLEKSLNLDRLHTGKIKVKPKFLKHYVAPIFSHLFFLFVIFFAAIFFIQTSHFVGIMCFIVVFPILLLLNTSAIQPGLAKLKFIPNKYELHHVK